jgi:hypothetical protein
LSESTDMEAMQQGHRIRARTGSTGFGAWSRTATERERGTARQQDTGRAGAERDRGTAEGEDRDSKRAGHWESGTEDLLRERTGTAREQDTGRAGQRNC